MIATIAERNGQATAARTRASNSEVAIGRAHLITKTQMATPLHSLDEFPGSGVLTGENIQKTCRLRAVKDSQTRSFCWFAKSDTGQQGRINSKLCRLRGSDSAATYIERAAFATAISTKIKHFPESGSCEPGCPTLSARTFASFLIAESGLPCTECPTPETQVFEWSFT